ncbi:MAG: hypothetical protein UHN41_06095 [Bacteroidales bacterium]|nr:hypothetical protein [Bacteroidales bacterium]MEE1190321.1 hypothetical protein [Bacteroidales bacterium]
MDFYRILYNNLYYSTYFRKRVLEGYTSVYGSRSSYYFRNCLLVESKVVAVSTWNYSCNSNSGT